jgi:hypothetical protein
MSFPDSDAQYLYPHPDFFMSSRPYSAGAAFEPHPDPIPNSDCYPSFDSEGSPTFNHNDSFDHTSGDEPDSYNFQPHFYPHPPYSLSLPVLGGSSLPAGYPTFPYQAGPVPYSHSDFDSGFEVSQIGIIDTLGPHEWAPEEPRDAGGALLDDLDFQLQQFTILGSSGPVHAVPGMDLLHFGGITAESGFNSAAPNVGGTIGASLLDAETFETRRESPVSPLFDSGFAIPPDVTDHHLTTMTTVPLSPSSSSDSSSNSSSSRVEHDPQRAKTRRARTHKHKSREAPSKRHICPECKKAFSRFVSTFLHAHIIFSFLLY